MECEKKSFNKRAAKVAALILRDQTGIPFRYYPCEKCKRYHLSSRDPSWTRTQKPKFQPRKGRRVQPGQTLEELAKKMRG
jgi:hypothetical protein